LGTRISQACFVVIDDNIDRVGFLSVQTQGVLSNAIRKSVGLN
jgi:hypothetical protein